MKLFIKPETPEILEMYRNHSHYNPGDSGIDLFFPENVILHKGNKGIQIHLGIQCEARSIDDLNNISYYLYPRSSISKTPVRMSNSVGIIDSGYRGSIIVALDYIGEEETYTIQKGTRLFQICSPTLEPIQMQITDTLSPSERGNDGFGSTGN